QDRNVDPLVDPALSLRRRSPSPRLPVLVCSPPRDRAGRRPRTPSWAPHHVVPCELHHAAGAPPPLTGLAYSVVPGHPRPGTMAPMSLPTPSLHTERLRLRPFSDADADALFALHSNAY